MNKILIDNAYEAWKNAVRYHRRILNGLFTLENKKGFVSSLHNAVELFLKQIMLDDNNHKVAWVRKTNTIESAQMQLNYLKSTDLNTFFELLSANELLTFYSIDFTELMQKAHKLLNTPESDKYIITDALQKLQDLRNAETHFYVDEKQYLIENDFIVLWRFMSVFYKLVANKDLFPCETISSSGKTIKFVDEMYRVNIDYRCNEEFCYISTLKQNSIYQKIIKRLTNIHQFNGDARIADVDNLSWEVWRYGKGNRFSMEGAEEIDQISIILTLLKTYNIIAIEKT